ncbi:MAG: hypothetical protein ACO1TE_27205 [Prosthecobacter sp.]
MQTPSLPAFDFGSVENFDSVRDCVPPRLLALAAKGPALLGLEPRTVVVAGLAHSAAALGRSTLLDDGTAHTSSAFSLAALSDTPLPSNWLSTIGRGWLDQVHRFSSVTPEIAQAAIRQHIQETSIRKPGVKTRDPQMDGFMEQIPETLVNMLRVQFISNRVDPVTVSRSLVNCSDHSITLLNGAVDPLSEWSHLTPCKQRQCTEMITLSWNGRPLSITPQGAETLSSLTCLWQTRTEHLRRAWFSRESEATRNPPPILLFRQQGTPKRFPSVQSKDFVEWSQWLGAAFEFRLKQPKSYLITLDPQARQLAENWFTEFATVLGSMPAPAQRWLCWLPDLVLRLYQLLLIGRALDKSRAGSPKEPEGGPSRNDSPQEMAMVMSQAIRLTRWLSHEHYQVVQEFMGQTNASQVSTVTDTTDMEALQEDILRRLRDNGPLKRRELQRTFHHLPAAARDRALHCLKSRGQIHESPDGELKVAA